MIEREGLQIVIKGGVYSSAPDARLVHKLGEVSIVSTSKRMSHKQDELGFYLIKVNNKHIHKQTWA